MRYPLKVFPKELGAVFIQREGEQQAENSAGDDLACSHRQKREPQRTDAGCVEKHKRNDDRVRQYGREGSKKDVFRSGREEISGRFAPCISQLPGPERADQSCGGTEDNIRKSAAGQDIADQTANKQSRYSGGGKQGKDGKSFRETDLNRIVRESEGVGHEGEHNVEGSDHRRLGEQVDVFLVHLFFSFSFVLGEEGLELTGIMPKNPDSMGVSSFSSISGKGELSRADSNFDSTFWEAR